METGKPEPRPCSGRSGVLAPPDAGRAVGGPAPRPSYATRLPRAMLWASAHTMNTSIAITMIDHTG